MRTAWLALVSDACRWSTANGPSTHLSEIRQRSYPTPLAHQSAAQEALHYLTLLVRPKVAKEAVTLEMLACLMAWQVDVTVRCRSHWGLEREAARKPGLDAKPPQPQPSER